MSVCCIDWCLDYHGRAACNQVPAVCYAAPVSCEALAPFLPALSTEPLFDLAEIGPSPEPYHKGGSVIHRRAYCWKNYPEGRKEHDRILHELFLASDISLAGPNTDWSLVGTWKWKWINWHCWRKRVDYSSFNVLGSFDWSSLSLIVVYSMWSDFQDLRYSFCVYTLDYKRGNCETQI